MGMYIVRFKACIGHKQLLVNVAFGLVLSVVGCELRASCRGHGVYELEQHFDNI